MQARKGPKLAHLSIFKFPALLVETLIMNERLLELEMICSNGEDIELRAASQELVHVYARKAIFAAPPHRR